MISLLRHTVAIVAATLLVLTITAPNAGAGCGDTGVAVQVLGSGGPVADDGRAASGYLVWRDGRAITLVDAGGGIFLRFGEAGAKIADLDAILLTHLHADHTSDLPALLKAGYFSKRTRPLVVAGPSKGGPYPAVGDFLHRLLDPQRGAFAYLAGYLDGSDGLFRLRPVEVARDATTPVTVVERADQRVTAVGVHHGPVPALGYLVETAGVRIAFSGDQRGDAPAFVRLIHGADLLVMDHAIPEQAGPVARNLHATPSQIGHLATAAHVHRLLLSHLMARSIAHLDESQRIIRRVYPGEMTVAEDLQCIPIPSASGEAASGRPRSFPSRGFSPHAPRVESPHG